MQVYLLRHGTAHDAKPGSKDSERELTEEGIADVKRVLKAASGAGVKPTLILTSSYVRARATAALAKKVLGTKEDLVETKTLVPEAEPQITWAELCDHRKEESVLLVSHNPLMEQLISFFLNAPTLQVEVKKGALVAMEIGNFRGQPNGVLQWLITPDLA